MPLEMATDSHRDDDHGDDNNDSGGEDHGGDGGGDDHLDSTCTVGTSTVAQFTRLHPSGSPSRGGSAISEAAPVGQPLARR